ncbi:hypothetical protein OHA21_05550 [Actinoplanes sp. NBC_00393]|uniref:hypothetical protein n=1 Tax=Actinoplanes sp. NBC_00393 TaxID=2975953 RepID=UPI002E2464CF
MDLRRIAAFVIAVVPLATVAALGGGTPASAAIGCDGGLRSTARYWASIDDFTTPTTETWIDGTSFNKVELRYNGDADCAWGLYNGGRKASVYVEFWENGMLSRYDRQDGSKSAYTGVWPIGRNEYIRACAQDAARIYCTKWLRGR